MKIKIPVYTLVQDNDNGHNLELFTDEQKWLAAQVKVLQREMPQRELSNPDHEALRQQMITNIKTGTRQSLCEAWDLLNDEFYSHCDYYYTDDHEIELDLNGEFYNQHGGNVLGLAEAALDNLDKGLATEGLTYLTRARRQIKDLVKFLKSQS